MFFLSRTPSGTKFSREEALLRASALATPMVDAAQDRVRTTLQYRISAEALLRASKAVEPVPGAFETIWNRIRDTIEPVRSARLLDRIRMLLTPSEDLLLLLKDRILFRLAPVPVSVTHRALKWTTAFALVLFAVRLSPLLFLAPRSVAESTLMLLPTRGDVRVLIDGTWQPVNEEMRFTQSVLLQTGDGDATLVLHDDGLVRLGPRTTIALHDTADRPAAVLHEPSLTLHGGKVWVQGLLPSDQRGITIALSQGIVSVHEGGLAITDEDAVSVRIFHQSADLLRNSETKHLVAGDRVLLTDDAPIAFRKILSADYDDSWISENLRRDAVHRREIAELQRARRARLAGILPTSPLYSVKRVAEAVDILLTFGDTAKTQKRLDVAGTRLNEAAALLAEGNDMAAEPLAEYKDALLKIATGTGGDAMLKVLIEQELADATATVSAALPDDSAYLLKQTVLEASAALPGSTMQEEDIRGMLLADRLSAMMRAVEEGRVEEAKTGFEELKPTLETLTSAGLRQERIREARASLATFASALTAFQDEVGGIDPKFLGEVARYLPASSASGKPLSEEQIMVLVQGMYDRIFLYKNPRPRWNQLLAEFRSLDGNPDQGRILRRLFRKLPENGLAQFVKTEFERVKEEKEEEMPKML